MLCAVFECGALLERGRVKENAGKMEVLVGMT